MSSGRPARDTSQSSAISSAILSRYQTLRRLLIKTSYTSPFPPELFLSAAPPALTLPILSHVLLSYSAGLTGWLLGSGFLLSSGSFSLSALYGLLGSVFGYRPQLSQQQFSSERGYVERKLQLLCDVLQMCVAKAEELEREKSANGGSAGRGGVPRVAVMVKEQRRSAGEQPEERKEQHRRQPSVVNTQKRQEKREERKEEQYEDEDGEDSGSPQHRQHQHVSFTHDDSSQPLSPSHLSPLSSSIRSPHRLSPPTHSHPHSRSSVSSTTATDPLLALHQQLHRISHRTNQLSHSQDQQQPSTTQTTSPTTIQHLSNQLKTLQTTLQTELTHLRQDVHDLRQRLAAVEQREWEREQARAGGAVDGKQAGKAVVEEAVQVKEVGGGGLERVTVGGGGGGGEGGAGSSSGSSGVLPSDMSEFLTHMNDRLSSTAKLLESSRRARGRLSEGA